MKYKALKKVGDTIMVDAKIEEISEDCPFPPVIASVNGHQIPIYASHAIELGIIEEDNKVKVKCAACNGGKNVVTDGYACPLCKDKGYILAELFDK